MSFPDVLLRVLVACALGAVIGFEREMKNRPAGLRTNMLTALAACVFTIVTLTLARDFEGYAEHVRLDPIRIIEAVTAGAAFLAAGAIIHSGGNVRGLTTGAGVWLAAAAGLACGAGYFAVATLATLVAFLILFALGLVESKLSPHTEGSNGDRSGDL
jgi:putative Mg2+ transporter-C (MgtC) family protein